MENLQEMIDAIVDPAQRNIVYQQAKKTIESEIARFEQLGKRALENEFDIE